MKARMCLKDSYFPCHTTSHRIQHQTGTSKKLKNLAGKLLQQYRSVFLNVTAMIFTGTVFVGGSYFFFIQLAEYGW